jgi:hypothetical protein
MSRARLIATFVAMVATLVLATGVQASQSTAVTITVLTGDTGTDTFTATGGVVCSTGTVTLAWGRFIGYQRNTGGAQILLDKHFECGDGTFEILLRVSLDFNTCDTVATWSVQSGTDAYANLRGAGTLTGESDCNGEILDVYTGDMHFN